MNIQSIRQSALFRTANLSQNHTTIKAATPQVRNSLLQNRDTLTLSPRGKKTSLVNRLMDQKKFLTELRDYTMQKGLKNGYMDHGKLDEYEKQLKALDEQIAQAMMQEAQKDTEETFSSAKKKTLTKEEYEQQKMAALADLSSSVSQADVVISEKGKVDREANILNIEIKLDESRALDGSSVSESKIERVAELEIKSQQLMQEVQGRLEDINTSIKENAEDVEIKDEEQVDSEEKQNREIIDIEKEESVSEKEKTQNMESKE